MYSFPRQFNGRRIMPRIRYKVMLTDEERGLLEEVASRGKHSSQKVLNALILLGCDEGPLQEKKLTGQQLADVLRVSLKKIDRTKRRFVEEGLEVALDKRKAEREYVKKADGDFEAHLVALSCSTPPEGHARWSLRLLADQVVELGYIDSVSHETVRRVLKKTG
jgi:hypothetical protein